MKTPRPRVVIGLIALMAGCMSPGGFASRQAAKDTPQIAQSAASKSEGVHKEFRPSDPVADSKGIAVDGFQKTAEDPVDDLIEQARAEEHNKHLDEARSLYLSVLDRQPNNATANHRLGVLAAINKNYPEAERYYRAALRESPKNAALLSDMGFTYLNQDRLNDSELALQQALQYDSKNKPLYKTIHKNLAQLYARRAQVSDSREDYERAYEEFRVATSEEFAQERLHQLFPNGPPGGGSNIASENPFAPQESQDNPFAVAAAEPPVEAPPPTTRNPSRTGMNVAQVGGPASTRGAPPKITPAVRAAYGPDTSRDGANDDTAVFGQPDSVRQPTNYNNVAGPVITPARGTSRADAMRGNTGGGMGTNAATPPASEEKAFAGGSSAAGIPDWPGEVPAAANAAPAMASNAWGGGNAMTATSMGNDRGLADLQRQAALLGMQAGMGSMFPVVDVGAGAATDAQSLPKTAPITPPATFAPSSAPPANRGAAPLKQAGQTTWPQWPGATTPGSGANSEAVPVGGAAAGNVVPAGGAYPQGGAAAVPNDNSGAVVDQFEAEMNRQAQNSRGLMPTANAAPMQ